jgi:hypothetical protein
MIEGSGAGSVPRTKYPDPDLGGLKTHGYYGSKSGYATLLDRMLLVCLFVLFEASRIVMFIYVSAVYFLSTSCLLPVFFLLFFLAFSTEKIKFFSDRFFFLQARQEQ